MPMLSNLLCNCYINNPGKYRSRFVAYKRIHILTAIYYFISKKDTIKEVYIEVLLIDVER